MFYHRDWFIFLGWSVVSIQALFSFQRLCFPEDTFHLKVLK